jgi:hypothetical protein
MLDLLEQDSATWHQVREAALEKKLLSFELVSNRINTTSAKFVIYRAKIPGGWLVALRPHDNLTFVPDPQHKWTAAPPNSQSSRALPLCRQSKSRPL